MHLELDEAIAPKYALFERERRWLVDLHAGPDLKGRQHRLIEDRYITGSRLRLRCMTDSMTGNRARKLTKKYLAADPLARPIVTIYLTEAESRSFEALPAWPLVKRRFAIAHGGEYFSVDLFEGALDGLALAEIEQADDVSLRKLVAPPWAGREVTDDPRYQGATLAQFGAPQE